MYTYICILLYVCIYILLSLIKLKVCIHIYAYFFLFICIYTLSILIRLKVCIHTYAHIFFCTDLAQAYNQMFGNHAQAHSHEDFSCTTLIHIPIQDFYKYGLGWSKLAANGNQISGRFKSKKYSR